MANSPQLQTAIRAALKAGKIISRESGNVDSIEVHEKTQFDFFSRVDTECQETIYGILKAAFPRDGFVAEENGVAEHTDAECVWYIDPLDGTTNFLHGFPQYAVSIGMTYRGKLTIGVVYDPSRNELFYAEKGKGAFMNDARIRVSGRSDFSQALIGTGFPFRKTDDYASFMPKFERVARAAAGLRRAGSAALDLSWVACGRMDAFWEYNLKSWDLAAGALIVLEAGGLVTDMKGGEGYLGSGCICAGTPKIFAPLIAKVGDIK